MFGKLVLDCVQAFRAGSVLDVRQEQCELQQHSYGQELHQGAQYT